MDIDLSRFRETFFQEAAEHTAAMESALLGLESRTADRETLDAIFRCAHSIKAGAAAFGFEAVSRLAHEMETLLDALRAGEMLVSTGLVDLLLRSLDILREILRTVASGDSNEDGNLASVITDLKLARTPPVQDAPEGAGAREYRIEFQPDPEVFRMGLDPLLALRDLGKLGVVRDLACDLSRLPALAALDPEICYLSWRLRLATTADLNTIRDVFVFFEDLASIAIAPVEARDEAEPCARKTVSGAASTKITGPVLTPANESIRVSTEKVDRLIDLVGELVIAQSMAAQIMSEFRPELLAKLCDAVQQTERHTRELQQRVMRIRMLPVSHVFNRFPRLVRDAAASLGKQVVVTMTGEDTELDKSVVERIADPLTHLVRNAIDHGIEPPEERQRLGKPLEGDLRLSAYQQGGNVIIEVADDGRGLDCERIRAKALERQLIDAETEFTDEQISGLIFRPGFSTAPTVTDLSGRGVGMDVVKRAIEGLNGAVSVQSRRGAGACFRVKIPLTLAILDGLLLRTGAHVYVLPLSAILETIRPQPRQISSLAGAGEVVLLRAEPLPLIRLYELFGIEDAVTDPQGGLCVIVEHEGQRLALLIDELLGQQQVVIKNLETNFRKVEGVAGATILGDGRAALILDVAGLIKMSGVRSRQAACAQGAK